MKKKTFVIALCLALVVAFAAGGAIAWLTDTTDPVTNTFTVGNIDITLAETTTDFKMIPGNTIAKNPKVTVTAGSEDSWVFVKVDKSANLGTYISYEIADGWTALSGYDGVYYREYTGSAAASYDVLKNNQVTVNSSVTTAQMQAAETSAPTLTFTAYAIQKANVADATTAWTEVSR